MRSKHFILLLLVPLSEIKALFYNSDMKVRFSLYTNDKKFLCNVVEDYSNVLIFGVLVYYFAFSKQDLISRKICLFLFILNGLDLLHFGLMDLPYLVIPKIAVAYIILIQCLKSKQLLSNF